MFQLVSHSIVTSIVLEIVAYINLSLLNPSLKLIPPITEYLVFYIVFVRFNGISRNLLITVIAVVLGLLQMFVVCLIRITSVTVIDPRIPDLRTSGSEIL